MLVLAATGVIMGVALLPFFPVILPACSWAVPVAWEVLKMVLKGGKKDFYLPLPLESRQS